MKKPTKVKLTVNSRLIANMVSEINCISCSGDELAKVVVLSAKLSCINPEHIPVAADLYQDCLQGMEDLLNTGSATCLSRLKNVKALFNALITD